MSRCEAKLSAHCPEVSKKNQEDAALYTRTYGSLVICEWCSEFILRNIIYLLSDGGFEHLDELLEELRTRPPKQPRKDEE